jgi:mannitol/fructose-specific phosphotransferase system IIA component (Ntr-type)
MEIWKHLRKETIRLDMETGTKEEIFAELVDSLLETGQVDPELPVLKEVLRREAVLSTGVGNGVALPHARLANFKGWALSFGRPCEPVDVDAVDGQPADLFFLLIADRNDPGTIVKILGRLARLCDDVEMRKGLRKYKSPAKIIELFQKFETGPVETPGKS